MRVSLLSLLLLLLPAVCAAQTAPAGLPSPTAGPVQVQRYERVAQSASTAPFDEHLHPFYHGVASGDPLADGVILWTRVTPDEDGAVPVSWRVATDPALEDVVQTGDTVAVAARDYTVKVDVRGLEPGTTYYYAFEALGQSSLVGRTRTAPVGPVDHLRFAVVSCSNYPAGFFNAYDRIADRADLDAVFHLGDYLYEYPEGTYGGERGVEPDTELLTLDDYRIRHSLYKLDPMLRRAHQQHPFITVWDDHESANDAWTGGAENHDPATEGAWEEREADARRAYFEWMPIRTQPVDTQRVYRTLRYGDLADVFMIDTRLEGRQQQLAPKGETGSEVDTAAWFAEDRTLLGAEQLTWLTGELAASQARWKVLGNQVMMMQIAPHPSLPAQFTFTNLDAWDGYPAERARLLGFLADHDIDDVVVMTGDIHSSWSGDLPLDPFSGYDPATGQGSVAVELVTTSITSATFGEGVEAAGIPVETAAGIIRQSYPQIRHFDLARRGYYVLDLKPDSAQADWFYVEILEETTVEVDSGHVATRAGANHLRHVPAAAAPKADPPVLAPADPPSSTAAAPVPRAEDAVLMIGVYPNPASGPAGIGYVLARPRTVRADLYDVLGRHVRTLLDAHQPAGTYAAAFDTADLAPGTYLVRLTAGDETATRTLVVR